MKEATLDDIEEGDKIVHPEKEFTVVTVYGANESGPFAKLNSPNVPDPGAKADHEQVRDLLNKPETEVIKAE